MVQAKIKVSFDVRNVQGGIRHGFVSHRTTKFASMKQVSEFLQRIYKGLKINGYEIYSTPTIEN